MRFYDAISKDVSQSLKDIKFEILNISKTEKVETDTGEIKKYLKFEVEVPRGIKYFARCRLAVKVADSGDLPVTEDDLAEKEYFVRFRDLKITYISSSKEVYFSAGSFYLCDIEAEVDSDHY